MPKRGATGDDLAASSERYRVTVAGGGGKAVANGTNLGLLAAKARELALDGWTSFVKNRRGSVVEVRKEGDGGLVLIYKRGDADMTGPADGSEPEWAQRVRRVIESI